VSHLLLNLLLPPWLMPLLLPLVLVPDQLLVRLGQVDMGKRTRVFARLNAYGTV